MAEIYRPSEIERLRRAGQPVAPVVPPRVVVPTTPVNHLPVIQPPLFKPEDWRPLFEPLEPGATPLFDPKDWQPLFAEPAPLVEPPPVVVIDPGIRIEPKPQTPPPAPPVVPPQVITPEWEAKSADEVAVVFAQVVSYLKQNPGKEITIGRNDRADVIIREDKTLSGRHAIVCYDGTNFWVKDLDSTNGTFYKKQKIKPFARVTIREGETIWLGPKTKLCFVEVEQSPTKAIEYYEQTLRAELTYIVGRHPAQPPDGIDDDATVLDPRQEYPVVSDEAIALRDQVRHGNFLLLFSRNTNLDELADIAREGKMVEKGRHGVKFFRYGLSHEYGEFVIIMKPGFWEQEREGSALGNLFMPEINGRPLVRRRMVYEGTMRRQQILQVFERDPVWRQFFENPDAENLFFKPDPEELIKQANLTPAQRDLLFEAMIQMRVRIFEEFAPEIDKNELLDELRGNIDYNRLLGKKDSENLPEPDAAGHTVLGLDKIRFMGYYPQLEVGHEIPLGMIEQILVPEHLWAQANKAVAGNNQVRALLQRVDGTGRNEQEFLEGRDEMARRSL